MICNEKRFDTLRHFQWLLSIIKGFRNKYKEKNNCFNKKRLFFVKTILVFFESAFVPLVLKNFNTKFTKKNVRLLTLLHTAEA